jgi:hypothetical protein
LSALFIERKLSNPSSNHKRRENKRRGYKLETFIVKLIPVRNGTQQLSLMNKIIFVDFDPVKIEVVYFEIGIGRTHGGCTGEISID